ncbi:MAG: DUF4411 family protein [Burkholderiaceae bacterium]|nr:DUF4411 family protein [Burkholderiaceae bacterium]
MKLLLDANAFLTPALTYYAFDICGGYWNWLAQAAAEGKVASIAPVKRELQQKDDQVKNWIEMHGSSIFMPDDASIRNSMGQVASWASSNGYTSAAVSDFLSKADSYLIAYALHGNHQIVTLETRAPGSRSKIKIPDAGDAHGISSISPFEMLRRNGVRL